MDNSEIYSIVKKKKIPSIHRQVMLEFRSLQQSASAYGEGSKKGDLDSIEKHANTVATFEKINES